MDSISKSKLRWSVVLPWLVGLLLCLCGALTVLSEWSWEHPKVREDGQKPPILSPEFDPNLDPLSEALREAETNFEILTNGSWPRFRESFLQPQELHKPAPDIHFSAPLLESKDSYDPALDAMVIEAILGRRILRVGRRTRSLRLGYR